MPEFLARFLTCASRPRHPAAVLLALLAVLAEFGGDGVRLALRYERAGLATGEWWRLASAHFVHLGPSHMLLDVAALVLLNILLGPYLKTRDWLIVTAAGMLTIDAGLYWLNPALQWYLGLSGLLHAYWATGCLLALTQRDRRVLGLAILLVVKLGYEALAGPVALTGQLTGGPVITQAHWLGAAGGTLAWVLIIATRPLQRPL